MFFLGSLYPIHLKLGEAGLENLPSVWKFRLTEYMRVIDDFNQRPYTYMPWMGRKTSVGRLPQLNYDVSLQV